MAVWHLFTYGGASVKSMGEGDVLGFVFALDPAINGTYSFVSFMQLLYHGLSKSCLMGN